MCDRILKQDAMQRDLNSRFRFHFVAISFLILSALLGIALHLLHKTKYWKAVAFTYKEYVDLGVVELGRYMPAYDGYRWMQICGVLIFAFLAARVLFLPFSGVIKYNC